MDPQGQIVSEAPEGKQVSIFSKQVETGKDSFVERMEMVPSAFLPAHRLYENTPSPESFWTTDQFDGLFRWAVTELNISDIEIEESRPPYVKYNGVWKMACRRVLSRIDVEAFIDHISRNRVAAVTAMAGEPLDFRYEVEMRRNEYRRFRCNVTCKMLSNGMQAHSVIMRAISDRLPTIQEVGIESKQELACYLPQNGLVVLSGPMGSGKTSTLAAIIKFRREYFQYESIGEYANPVEYDYSACNGHGPLWQVEIPQGLPNMRAAASNMARRSPNVIIIGESRDRDSFQAVLDTSNMSVCLYTTLHASDVPNIISRIVNTMPEEIQNTAMGTIIEMARYFVNQRLVEGTPLPDGRPRRVPLRESLLFTSAMKMELMSINNLNLAICRIHEYLGREGRTLLRDAEDKYKKGLLPEKVLRLVRTEFEEREKTVERTYLREQKGRVF